MTTRHPLRPALVLLPLTALLFLACGSGPSSPSGVAGAGGIAGSGAGSGGGGGFLSGGAGSLASGAGQGGKAGKGGKGGKGGGGQGGGGTEPDWQFLGDTQDCVIYRLQNPSLFRVFTWKPCDWTKLPGCEEASFSEDLIHWKNNPSIYVGAFDDGKIVRSFLTTNRYDEQFSFIMDEDGQAIEGFLHDGGTYCNISIPDIGVPGYGVTINAAKERKSGLVLGKWGESPQVLNWETSGPLSSTIVTWTVAGNKYLASQWMGFGQQSMPYEGGKPALFEEVLKLTPDATGVDNLVAAGDYFLYSLFSYADFKSIPHVMISDGINPGIPYTNPPPGASDGSVGYADSHVAWLRGFNQQETNVFEKVEIWASEFSPDPSKLDPYKVSAITGGQNTTSNWAIRGGWGKIAYGEYDVNMDMFVNIRVRVYDLKTLEKKDLPVPPGEVPRFIHGVTRTHVWFNTDQFDNAPKRLFRWKLAEVAPVP